MQTSLSDLLSCPFSYKRLDGNDRNTVCVVYDTAAKTQRNTNFILYRIIFEIVGKGTHTDTRTQTPTQQDVQCDKFLISIEYETLPHKHTTSLVIVNYCSRVLCCIDVTFY